MKIQEELKGLDFISNVDFEKKSIEIKAYKDKELVHQFNFIVNENDGDDFSDYWNTIKVNEILYDFNFYCEDEKIELTVFGLGLEHVDTQNYMSIDVNIIVGDTNSLPASKEKNEKDLNKELIRKTANNTLTHLFGLMQMDIPENMDYILSFVSERVYEMSEENDGFHSEGDIIQAFREFIEQK